MMNTPASAAPISSSCRKRHRVRMASTSLISFAPLAASLVREMACPPSQLRPGGRTLGTTVSNATGRRLGAVLKKILLNESDIPDRWYNILPDMPGPPAPYLNPQTLQPMGPADLAPIFPQAIIAQEVSAEPWIEIPDQVREIYRIWRPSPLYRADRLERVLHTPAPSYFKYEGVSPAGSHKPNTAVPQAYYNSKEGVRRLTTETGAGQWGSALAFAGALFWLDVTVYMVKISYEQKPYRRAMMETWGATVHASPTKLTNAGRGLLADAPDSPGSLGIAISEAVEDAATHDDAKYSLGSVVNHGLLHQTVIGLEAKKQMEMAGESPDVVVACVGGGAKFARLRPPPLGAQGTRT